MPAISRTRAIAYVAVVVCLLVLGGKLLLGATGADEAGGSETIAALEPESGADPGADEAPVDPATGPEPAGADDAELVVHVAGAVRRPGLYRLREGSRVADAVRRAGGAKPRAALDLLNLAAPIADGQQVLVPLRAGPGAAPGSAPPASSASGSPVPAPPLNLNTATLEELDELPGVGPVTAQRILDYRAEHGTFRSIVELDAVSGIGPARMEQLRELVTL